MRQRTTKFHKVTPSSKTISSTSIDLIDTPMTDRVQVRVSHTHATDILYILPSPVASAVAVTTANGIPIPPNQERVFNWGTDLAIKAIRGAANDIRVSVVEEAD